MALDDTGERPATAYVDGFIMPNLDTTGWSDSEIEDKRQEFIAGLKEMYKYIIQEIIDNAEVTLDVYITDPTGLVAGADPVTGSTLNANTNTGGEVS